MLLYRKTVGKENKGNKKELGLKEWGILLGAGTLLITLSVPGFFGVGTKEEKGTETTLVQTERICADTTEDYVQHLETRLEELLSQVEGAGAVRVMITVRTSKEKIVLKDENSVQEITTEQDGAGGIRTITQTEKQEESVMKQADGEELPYVTKELEPEIEGVVVLTEGTNVNLDMVEAVQALFDLPVHKIKILKMKK